MNCCERGTGEIKIVLGEKGEGHSIQKLGVLQVHGQHLGQYSPRVWGGVLYAGRQKSADVVHAVVSRSSPRKLAHRSFNLLKKALAAPYTRRSPDLLVDLKRT